MTQRAAPLLLLERAARFFVSRRFILLWLTAQLGPGAAMARPAPQGHAQALRLSWTLEWGASPLSLSDLEGGGVQASHASGAELSYERRFFFDRRREGYQAIEVGLGYVWGGYEIAPTAEAWGRQERPQAASYPFEALTVPLVYKLGVLSYAPFFISRGAVMPGRVRPDDVMFDVINAYVSGGLIADGFSEGGGPEGWALSPVLSFGMEAMVGAVSLRFFEMTWRYRLHASPPHPGLRDAFPEKMMRLGLGVEL
ncbi:hypothetical protein KKF91_06330 [Myxococcota bacterium]|nr:hypothetical protein [Myxococcota bacterium]MBU1430170.1 hypothetical protein [Myxococcota bacterium]MBU1900506.1 hypothetical protein [Myxococcota bacterium]